MFMQCFTYTTVQPLDLVCDINVDNLSATISH